ncbi:Transcription initiation factor TFIID subunit 12 [Agyrium rufum]|nr:Transcription initiation factor TFIID subunit 12 [Agyrium rufum]
MNNTHEYPPPPGMPQLSSLIKPDQIDKIAAIPQEKKAEYTKGVRSLWDTIQKGPNDANYVPAFEKLVTVSNHFKQMIQRFNAEKNQKLQQAAAAQQNGEHTPVVAQPPQLPQAAAQQPPRPAQPQMSGNAINHAKQLKIVAHPNFWQRPEEAKSNIQEQRTKYAQNYTKLEMAQRGINQIKQTIQMRERDGNPLSEEEKRTAQMRHAQFDKASREVKEWFFSFDQQQNRWKAQEQQQQSLSEGAGLSNQGQSDGTVSEAPASSMTQPIANVTSMPAPSSSDAIKNAPSTSSAQGTGITQAGHLPRPSTSTSQPSAGSQAPNQALNPQQHPPPPSLLPQAHPQPPAAVGAPNMPTAPSSLNLHNIPAANSQPQPPSQLPQASHQQLPNGNSTQAGQPLSHKAAVAQANRSYSQPVVSQTTPQSAGGNGHTHPPNLVQRDQQPKNPQWQIPQKLNIPPPSPVPMGSARPTMSGGPSTGAPGPMGQPAVQKHPYFVLDGDGERILSKKKLEELVRQVTGGSEGEDAETLDPDVEETLLDVADEFVDNVIIAACRLAKLRSSATLELRDIQLILERNYNIRVPGYATDELRTVRKIQPTQTWTQKLSAVQAAKVTGGKVDL